jgi:Ca2+/H+ antiporter
MITQKNIKRFFLIVVGIFGMWLIYWDLTESVNTFLKDNGLPPAFIGAIIIIIVGYFGVKVFK